MARPKEHGERAASFVRLPVDLHARLKAAAAERDVSANHLVERAVRAYLDNLIPVDELLSTRRDA